MLEGDKFIAWANDNIFVVVGHNDPGHEALADGKCPLYPGLTCAEHQAASGELTNTEPKIPAESGVPNSWLIAPNGEIKKIEPVIQMIPAKIIEMADEWQKTLGPRLALKDYDKYQKAFADGDAAVEKADWRLALTSYQKVDKKKIPASLTQRLKDKVEALDKKVLEAWNTSKDGADDIKIKKAFAVKLISQISVSFSTGFVPTKALIETWMKENK